MYLEDKNTIMSIYIMLMRKYALLCTLSANNLENNGAIDSLHLRINNKEFRSNGVGY